MRRFIFLTMMDWTTHDNVRVQREKEKAETIWEQSQGSGKEAWWQKKLVRWQQDELWSKSSSYLVFSYIHSKGISGFESVFSILEIYFVITVADSCGGEWNTLVSLKHLANFSLGWSTAMFYYSWHQSRQIDKSENFDLESTKKRNKGSEFGVTVHRKG